MTEENSQTSAMQANRHLLRMVGFNINGLCSNKNKAKAKEVYGLLENIKPDVMILAETSISTRQKELIPHDSYIGQVVKIEDDDERKTRGKGMGILTKDQYNVYSVKQLEEPKQCAFRVKNSQQNIGFIAGGFHVANANGGVQKQSYKQLMQFLSILQQQYGESLILVYIDANEDLMSTETGRQIRQMGWQIGDPQIPTRRGYAGQRDTKIDFFLIYLPEKQKHNFSFTIRVNQNFPRLSDHKPIVLDLFTKQKRTIPILRTANFVIDREIIRERTAQIQQQLIKQDFNTEEFAQYIQSAVSANPIPQKLLRKKTWKQIFKAMEDKKIDSYQDVQAEFNLRYDEYIDSAFQDKRQNDLKRYHQKLQRATTFSKSNKIVNLASGPLKSTLKTNERQFQSAGSPEQNLLSNPLEIKQEVDQWIKTHFQTPSRQKRLSTNAPIITVDHRDVKAAISKIHTGKAFSADGVEDKMLDLCQIKCIVDQQVPHDLLNREQIVTWAFELACNRFYKNLADYLNFMLRQMMREGKTVHSDCRQIYISKLKDDAEVPTLDQTRPITIESCLLKLVELVLVERSETNATIQQISPSQVGFQKGLDTQVNLLRLIKDTHELRNTSSLHKINVIFLDFKSAFDSVCHERLFHRLHLQGFSTEWINTLRLIYYTTTINGNLIGKGVLQGAILSPAIFNRYLDPLIRQLQEIAPVYGYADDIAILSEGPVQTRRIIKLVEKWGKNEDLELNKNKCGILFFNPNSDRLSVWEKEKKDIRRIPIVSEYKYLGIQLNKCLDAVSHLDYLQGKIQKYERMQRILAWKQVSLKDRVEVLRNYGLPALLYGSFINSPFISKKKNLDKFSALYIRVLKSSFGIGKRQNNMEMLKQFDIPTPEQAIDINLIGVLHRWETYYRGQAQGQTARQIREMQQTLLAKYKLNSGEEHDLLGRCPSMTLIRKATSKINGIKREEFSWVKSPNNDATTIIKWAIKMKSAVFGQNKKCPTCQKQPSVWRHQLECALKNDRMQETKYQFELLHRLMGSQPIDELVYNPQMLTKLPKQKQVEVVSIIISLLKRANKLIFFK